MILRFCCYVHLQKLSCPTWARYSFDMCWQLLQNLSHVKCNSIVRRLETKIRKKRRKKYQVKFASIELTYFYSEYVGIEWEQVSKNGKRIGGKHKVLGTSMATFVQMKCRMQYKLELNNFQFVQKQSRGVLLVEHTSSPNFIMFCRN